MVTSKSNELCRLIQDIATEDVAFFYDDIMSRLAVIYDNGYRHMYSEIGQMVQNMDPHIRSDLADNMETLRYLMIKQYERDPTSLDCHLYEVVLKLSDHISLEIQRESVTEEFNQLMEWTQSDIKKKTGELDQKIADSNKALEAAFSSVNQLKEQIVAVLGVFSAIIVAVSTGANFLTSSIESIGGAGVSEALFIISLCAMLLFNLVYVMILYVDRILHRDDPKKPWLQRLNESAYVMAFDCVLAVIAILGFVCSYH